MQLHLFREEEFDNYQQSVIFFKEEQATKKASKTMAKTIDLMYFFMYFLLFIYLFLPYPTPCTFYPAPCTRSTFRLVSKRLRLYKIKSLYPSKETYFQHIECRSGGVPPFD